MQSAFLLHQNYTDDQSVGFLQDKVVQEKLANAKTLDKVNTDEYVALFYPGGSGPVLGRWCIPSW